MAGRKPKDYTGVRFSHLTGIRPIKREGGRTMWEWQCDCGNKVINYSGNVVSGGTISCGHVLASRTLEKKEANIRRYYRTYKRRGLTLSQEKFVILTDSKCSYCGDLPKVDNVNGIDKINPKLGYIDGNMICSCWDCNRMKSNMSQEAFLNHISKIYKNGKGI